MAKDTSATVSLQEYACSAGLKPNVNREKNVVEGVKILGLHSRNNREYPSAVVAKAMPLYENAASFVNHVKPGESRPYQDRVGTIKNVRPAPDNDGLIADFHYNPKASVIEQFLWDCEHAPGNAGFSHDVDGRTSRKNGKVVVEEIQSVSSVDIVAKAATTKTIFESADELPEGPERELVEHALSAVTDLREIAVSQESIETKTARLLETLAVWQGELAGEPVTNQNKETATMEWKDITESDLRANRKDLVEVLTGTDATSKLTARVTEMETALAAKDAAIKEATDKLAAADAEKAKQAKTIAIAEELKVAKLDTNDKVVCSARFMEDLQNAADAAGRKAIIEDRMALAKLRTQTNAPAGAPPFAPVGGLTEGIGTGATAKDTLARL